MAFAALAIIAFAVFLSFYYPKKYNAEIRAACERYDVDENLVRGVIHAESKFKPRAVSGAGAVGLMQLMPSTAEWIAAQTDNADLASDLFDPAANIMLGTAYLKYLLDKFPLRDALAAYNAGEGNLIKWQAENLTEYPYKETRDYVKRVIRAKTVYEKVR